MSDRRPFNTQAFERATTRYLTQAPTYLEARFPRIWKKPLPARVLAWLFERLAEEGYDEAFAEGASIVIHIRGKSIIVTPYERNHHEPHDADRRADHADADRDGRRSA